LTAAFTRNNTMQLYIVKIDRRDEDGDIRGVFSTRELAIEALVNYCNIRYSQKSIKYCCEEFGCDPNKGEFSSEEETVTIVEKTLDYVYKGCS